MAVTPSSLAWTYTGVKSGFTSRGIFVTVPQLSGAPALTYSFSLSGTGYASGNPLLDTLIAAIDAQVASGTTSGTITITIT